MSTKPRIIVILGPTATGKSDLAVTIAKKHNGEVISADSRQVYKHLDIGTGKITKKEMQRVPHHMLDVVSPTKIYSVFDWQKSAEKCITDILNRGKLPIICGGTGFYIQSIVDGIVLPEVPPNAKLREKLDGKTPVELVAILQTYDRHILETIDTKNPARLVRAIEIAEHLGSVPPLQKKSSQYNILQIGLTLSKEGLSEKIHTRLLRRLKAGMVREAEKLHERGLSWKRMLSLGLEYRYLALFLTGNISRSEFIQTLSKEIEQYAKRQITWFKRDTRIQWFKPTDITEIEICVSGFLDSRPISEYK